MNVAIIPAGGHGKRFGSTTPKQLIKVFDKEIIVYTLEIFQKSNLIDQIVIAVPHNFISLILRLKDKYNLSKIIKVVEGGKERQDSVFNGLSSIHLKKNDLVIVHDAARPLLPQSILKNAIQCAKEKGNAVVCLKARDTLIKGNKIIQNYIDREKIYYVQTPQIFRYNDLLLAMKNAYKENFIATDESNLIKKSGKKINIIDGSPLNFKITTKEDLEMFKGIIFYKRNFIH